jgi:hypothetical protein
MWFLSWIWKPFDWWDWLYDRFYPVSAVVTVLLPPVILYLLADRALHGK